MNSSTAGLVLKSYQAMEHVLQGSPIVVSAHSSMQRDIAHVAEYCTYLNKKSVEIVACFRYWAQQVLRSHVRAYRDYRWTAIMNTFFVSRLVLYHAEASERAMAVQQKVPQRQKHRDVAQLYHKAPYLVAQRSRKRRTRRALATRQARSLEPIYRSTLVML